MIFVLLTIVVNCEIEYTKCWLYYMVFILYWKISSYLLFCNNATILRKQAEWWEEGLLLLWNRQTGWNLWICEQVFWSWCLDNIDVLSPCPFPRFVALSLHAFCSAIIFPLFVFPCHPFPYFCCLSFIFVEVWCFIFSLFSGRYGWSGFCSPLQQHNHANNLDLFVSKFEASF